LEYQFRVMNWSTSKIEGHTLCLSTTSWRRLFWCCVIIRLGIHTNARAFLLTLRYFEFWAVFEISFEQLADDTFQNYEQTNYLRNSRWKFFFSFFKWYCLFFENHMKCFRICLYLEISRLLNFFNSIATEFFVQIFLP